MNDAPIAIGMRPSSPGEFIRAEVLDELGLSVSRAAEVLGVRRATLSDLVNGKAGLSAEMALRIEKAFGVSMDTLLHMQAWHDSYVMRQRAGEIAVKRYVPGDGVPQGHLAREQLMVIGASSSCADCGWGREEERINTDEHRCTQMNTDRAERSAGAV